MKKDLNTNSVSTNNRGQKCHVVPAGSSLRFARLSRILFLFLFSIGAVFADWEQASCQVISVYAGNGSVGAGGDGGNASSATLKLPCAVAIDPVTQDLFIADEGSNSVRKIDRLTNNITTVIGNSSVYGGGYNGDNGIASAALLKVPTGIAIDQSQNIYIADAHNYRVRKINHVTGIVTTIAGNGFSGTAATSGQATASPLKNPSSVAVDHSGNLYFVDYPNGIYRIAVGGAISQILAGSLGSIIAIAFDANNNLYFTSNNHGIYKLAGTTAGGPTTGTPILVAGITGPLGGYVNGVALASKFNYPAGIAVDYSGNLFLADVNNERIREFNKVPGTVSDFAGNGNVSSGYNYSTEECAAATSVSLNIPATINSPFETGLAVDNQGNVFICDIYNHVVRRVQVGTSGITGPSTICGTDAVTLTGVPAGGRWSSSSTSIATIDPVSGVMDAVSTSGVDIVSYITPCSTSTFSVTLNSASALSISSSTSSLCVGATTTLTPSETGGSWSCSSTSVATVNAATGIVGGTGAGVAIITYTSSGGCYATKTISINSSSAATITGDNKICPGGTITLSSSVPLGIWSSSSPSIATVDPVTGVVGGVGSGSAIITYSYSLCSGGAPSTEITTKSITVTANPISITGGSDICINSSTYLLAGLGGIWSSSDNSVATVNASSGYVTGLIGGGTAGLSTVIISYTYSCGTTTGIVTTFSLSVHGPAPIGVSGDGTVCAGSSISLSEITTGGIWSSSSPAHASVSPTTGLTVNVTGVSHGTAYINYSITDSWSTCKISQLVTVIPDPPLLSFSGGVCAGSTTTIGVSPAGSPLSGATTPWQWTGTATGSLVTTSDAEATFTMGTTGGSATISYTAEYTYTACPTVYTFTATTSLNTEPVVGGITAPGSSHIICDLDPLHLSATGVVGDTYTWSSSNTAVATVDATGLGKGVSSVVGTATISYTEFACGTSVTATYPVTVVPVPAPITGVLSLCESDGVANTTTLSDASPSGIFSWNSMSPSLAPVTAYGVVYGYGAGTSVITYGYGNCYTSAVVTVNPKPYISPCCPPPICPGETITLTEAPLTGGTWTCSTCTITPIDPSTVVISFPITSSGNFSIFCTSPEAAGSCQGNGGVTINGVPETISGPPTLCRGTSTTLSDAAFGGTWSCIPTSVATINPTSGIISATTSSSTVPTTVNATYSTGCGPNAVKTLTIEPTPRITSTLNVVCANSNISMSANISGGTWSSSSTSIASVNPSSGVVTGISGGTVSIIYMLSTGCQVSRTITVNPLPDISVTSSSPLICQGGIVDLTGVSSTAISYFWSGSDGFSSTVANPEISPSVTTTYSVTVTDVKGCQNGATTTITVNPTPDISVAATYTTVCASTAVSLTGTSSVTTVTFSWVGPDGYSSTLSDPTVTPTVTTTYTLTVTGTDDCQNSATVSISVNPLPDPISSAGMTTSICAGSSLTLSDATMDPSATWSTSDILYVAISDPAVGVVSGINEGTATISYVLGTGCFQTFTLTINALPTIIPIPPVTSSVICYSSGGDNTLPLMSSPTGGSWVSSATAVATIDPATDIVTGFLAGTTFETATLTYTLLGCSSTIEITVDPTVSVSLPPVNIYCPGVWTSLLEADPTGGTAPYTVAWTPSASLDPSGGTSFTETIVSLTESTDFTAVVTDAYGCTAASDVYVSVPSGKCEPCTGADPSRPLLSLGTPSGTSGGLAVGASGAVTNMPVGNYYLDQDLEISGKVVFFGSSTLNSTIEINANSTIYVDGDAALFLNGNHLYSCPSQMWEGIVLGNLPPDADYPAGQNGVISLRANVATGVDSVSTLIEDARAAVTLNKPMAHNSWLPYYIVANSAIFNSNYIGISLQNFNSYTDMDLSGNYALSIQNSVFTCRDMTSGPTTSNYPFDWPNTNPGTYTALYSPLKGRIAVGISAYDNPYEIANYVGADCHIPKFMHDYIGIYMNNIGQNTYPTYNSVVVGTSTTEVSSTADKYNSRINLFDNLSYGVSVTNGNFILHNNAFVEPHISVFPSHSFPVYLGGYGVLAQMNDATLYQALIEPVYEYVPDGTATAINSFYSCKYGLYCKDYYHLKGDNSYIVTKQDYSKPSFDPNTFGYFVKTKAYDAAEFNHNQITATPNGISFTSTFAPGYYSTVLKMFIPAVQWAGSLQVNYNRINAAFTTDISDLSTHCTAFGISVQNAAGLSYIIDHVTGHVETNGNAIDRAWRGILVNGFNMQQVFTESNKISVRSHAGGLEQCYGISHTYSRNSFVWNNNVVGSDHADMTNYSLRAFYESHCTNPSIACNNESDLSQGYEFFLQNPNTAWHNNGITNNLRGFVLNQGIINQQGSPTQTMDNVWNGSMWGIANKQTYVVTGASSGTTPILYPLYSPFYVFNDGSHDPAYNDGDHSTDNYDLPGAIFTTTSPSKEDVCLKIQPGPGSPDAALHHPQTVYETYARNSAPFPALDTEVRSWTGQYLAWQVVNNDSDLINISPLLDSFVSMANNSRYSYVASIENSIINCDSSTTNYLFDNQWAPLVGNGQFFDSVTGAYVVDDSSADYIVGTHLSFYKIYQNYLNGAIECTDSIKLAYLANLCPPLYGPVVYQSRALYSAVFDALRVWTDSCDTKPDGDQCNCGQNGRGKRSGTSISSGSLDFSNQQYSLLPNPNKGTFIIQQFLKDIQPVRAVVMDELGREVYYNELQFVNGSANISIGNPVPGVYLVRLLDWHGRIFTLKFIVQ